MKNGLRLRRIDAGDYMTHDKRWRVWHESRPGHENRWYVNHVCLDETCATSGFCTKRQAVGYLLKNAAEIEEITKGEPPIGW